MISAVDSAVVARHLPKCTLAFVWSAWRGLTRRHFYYATLAGLGLASVEGTGVAMWVTGVWWKNFLSVFLSNVAQVLVLLLCLSVAANVNVVRGPRWTPFVVAAAIATVIAPVTQWTVGLLTGDRWSLYPLFVNTIGAMLFSILAALGYMFGFEAVRRTDVLRNLQLERTRIARDAYEARLKALQAQVEPRFLFDTLADIEAAYEQSPDAGQHLIDELIVYLRAALPTVELPTSLLSTELALVRAWLRIVQMRERSRLKFSITEPDRSSDFRMPSMILLPLVQHAVESLRASSHCTIAVSADIGERGARIVVTAGPGCELPTETAATAAIHERLRVIYGSQATFALVNNERNEYCAELEIPA
jgi:hypothetical protein